uniref:C2H2-type domain-containing protein n=1 Tax=Meloidogyne floridensis TaxID=298350 RepID=A0A915NLS1_9BILA
MNVKNKKSIIKCPCCLFEFDQLHWLISHLREIKNGCCFGADFVLNDSELFGCKFCLIPLQTANELANHLEICLAANNLKKEEQICLNEDQINFNFENKNNYNNLIKQCKYCTKSFKRNTDLQRHLLIHTGERPFTCSKCYFSFRTKQTLETHSKTHLNFTKEQYQCSFCQKYFLSRSSLKLHLRIHTGEAPFKCQNVECCLMFRTKKLMNTHYKNVHCQQIMQEDGLIIQEPINNSKSQQKMLNSFDNQSLALNGLLELNTKIGQRKCKKSLNLSENSAFVHFGENNIKRFEIGRRRKSEELQLQQHCNSIPFDMRTEQQLFEQQPIAFGEPPIRNIGSVPLYIDQNISNDLFNTSFNNSNNLSNLNKFNLSNISNSSTSYFFQSDAEYSRDGQVHSIHSLNGHSFRSLTPLIEYYINESNNEELNGGGEGIGGGGEGNSSNQQQQQQIFPSSSDICMDQNSNNQIDNEESLLFSDI